MWVQSMLAWFYVYQRELNYYLFQAGELLPKRGTSSPRENLDARWTGFPTVRAPRGASNNEK